MRSPHSHYEDRWATIFFEKRDQLGHELEGRPTCPIPQDYFTMTCVRPEKIRCSENDDQLDNKWEDKRPCTLQEDRSNFTKKSLEQAHGRNGKSICSISYNLDCFLSAPRKQTKKFGPAFAFDADLHTKSTQQHVDRPDIKLWNTYMDGMLIQGSENHLSIIWSNKMIRMIVVRWSREIIDWMMAGQSVQQHSIKCIVSLFHDLRVRHKERLAAKSKNWQEMDVWSYTDSARTVQCHNWLNGGGNVSDAIQSPVLLTAPMQGTGCSARLKYGQSVWSLPTNCSFCLCSFCSRGNFVLVVTRSRAELKTSKNLIHSMNKCSQCMFSAKRYAAYSVNPK